MTAPMTRDEVDRLLAELDERRHRVAGWLVAMDTQDSGLAYLRTTPGLSGATLELWERTRPRLDALWAGFTAVGTALDTAAGLRANGLRPARAQLAEIAALLRTPVADETLPDEYRGVTPTQLWQRLETECGQVRATLADVDNRVAALIARLSGLERTLDEARQAAGAALPELVDQAAALRELRARATGDPLGTDPDGPRIQTFAAKVEATAARLARQAASRAGYPGRRSALQDALTRLADAETGARDAYARATVKILDPRLPAATDQAPALRRRLATFDRLDRTALDQALPALEHAVTAAQESARERREFADGLLARRDELRGRLDAYRMKAVRTGLSERDDVHASYAGARALLWTAPCDLRAATRAVVAYQRSLLENPGGGAA